MGKMNGKLRISIITFSFSVFVVLVGWGSSFVTARVNRGKIEQEVEDTIQSHTYWIEDFEEDINGIKKDTSEIKVTLGRHDERLKNLKEQYNSIDSKLDKIWDKLRQ